MDLPKWDVEDIVRRALAEDIGHGDLTTESLVPEAAMACGVVRVRDAGVIAGLEVMALAFRLVDPSIHVELLTRDGMAVQPKEAVARVRGPARGMLKAERVALNFLQRLSGTATATARMVRAVAGLPVRIIDTRKTTPGLRLLERYAVRMGGGNNHRFNLSDGVLIKDNHLAVLAREGVGMREAVARARQAIPHTIRIEIEVETPEQAAQAADAGADVILFDNMSLEDMRRAVALVNGRALTEASGKINLDNVRAVAECGVDLASSGALTYAARALDIGLDFEED
ncbi:MAG: carboxylating nicotinate-nucleotide diphosphorylase [Chloroflexi bacterium]|nr:carboxylating nicotinate-nucleotide diphosphorylase [Chloroflexota bacterium]